MQPYRQVNLFKSDTHQTVRHSVQSSSAVPSAQSHQFSDCSLHNHNTVFNSLNTHICFIFNRICMVSMKKRSICICKDQWRRNQEKACRNTKRIKKGSAGQTYEEKDWSARSCERAQRTCPTTLILVIESITRTLKILLIKSQLLSITIT